MSVVCRYRSLNIILSLFPRSQPSGPHSRCTVQYCTVDCTVGGSKESRVGTVTLYGCPADAGGCYVCASSSRVAFRAFVVGAGCSAVVGLSLGLLADAWVVLQMSVSSCWGRSVRGSRFGGAVFRPFCCFWLGCLLRLVLGMERRGIAPVPAVGEGLGIFTCSWWATPCGAEGE